MQNLTLGIISNEIIWVIGFVTAIYTIVRTIKGSIKAGFAPIEKKIDKVDMNATKNFLVSKIADLKKGEGLDDVSRERFYEQYRHYTEDLHGNSYIKREVERLEKDGKL